ncbi:TetR/AcrR family transcriptional regulator [Streptomyces mesophilus]|uniref:TetR/AcrR family transcriptional regulator n=1 Tax=Streptomyces mesophilus TaxID=1775132 RepID=UPI0033213F60
MAQVDDDTGLPASLATAWGLRERPSKGPKPGLSLDRIVDQAVELAAAEGLGAVSMGRVAKGLGVSTMSLYRYVGAKDELYVLMQEAVYPVPSGPWDPATGWRAGLAQWAAEQRRIFQENLWLLRIPISGPPVSPKSVVWMERGLAVLADTGLSEGEKISVIMLVSGFVRQEALLMSDVAAAMAETGLAPDAVMRRYARGLRVLTDPERHPAMTRFLDSGVMDEADEPDAEFDFGLACVLDGVAALIERRSRP